MLINFFWSAYFVHGRNQLYLHTIRQYGRSKRVIAAGSKGANFHLIGCISDRGLVHHLFRRGSFNHIAKSGGNVWRPVILVVDNASCHSRVEEVTGEGEFISHTILRLASYSPMLNPIEHAWSFIKSDVKTALASQMPSILANEGHELQNQSNFRLVRLEEIVRSELLKFLNSMCPSYISHIQSFISAAIAKEDMQS